MKDLFKNKKVLIMGLGVLGGGVGTVKFFIKQGADLIITDKRRPKELKESLKEIKKFIKKFSKKRKIGSIKWVLGKHLEKDFKNCNLVLKNPAVLPNSPYLKIAKKNKIPIETETTIFFKYIPRKNIIAITGTKGKSSIAYFTYLFLKSKYKNTKIAGNIGISLLEELEKINKKSILVLELSSFQLEDLKKSPHIALISNIYPDHLNRYKTMKNYIKAKTPIFKYQKRGDILVLNYDNKYTKNFAFLKSRPKSSIYFYSEKSILPNSLKKGAFIKNNQIFFKEEKKPVVDLSLVNKKGLNVSNILASITLAKILKVSSRNIKKVLKKIKGLKNRIDFVKEIKGVKYFNDTTATIPEATINSIYQIKKRYPSSSIILIAGGEDKNLNYQKLVKVILKDTRGLILIQGSASLKIKKELKNKKFFYRLVKSMKEAVKYAHKISKKGDIVLLSPAAASFNLFRNEFERGEKFIKEVKKIKV